MTAAATRRRRGARPPSSRYLNLASSHSVLGAAGGARATITGLEQLVDAAEALAAGREAIVWIHEGAVTAWGLPETLGEHHAESVAELVGRPVRSIGATGWLAVDGTRPIHLAFPTYSGDFAGTTSALELLEAVEAFRIAVGFAYVISGAKTVHTLIGNTATVPESTIEPELDGWAATAWATPSNWWGLDAGGLELLEAAGARHVQAFDRVGSYLSAWQGINLPIGDWLHLGAGELEPGPESSRACGYWLLDADALPDTAGLFDPWARHGAQPGPRWVTTPLAQLAVELAEAPVPVLDAWVAAGRLRALDIAGGRLRAAREALRAPSDDVRRQRGRDAAYQVLKGAYAGATAWFEYGPRPPDPLARPSWRRTIIDRYAANTWRSLDRTSPGPFAVGEIDTAIYALAEGDTPDGLAIGDGLGQWRSKGRPVAIATARAALEAGGHRGLLRALETA